MGLVDKITGHSSRHNSHSSSSTAAPTHDHSTSSSVSKHSTGPNLVGDSDARTTTEHIHTGHTSSKVAAAADQATGIGERVRTGDDTYDRHTNAPVVKETIRDEYVHNVQPVIQEEHDRTEIIKTVQPLEDHQVRDTTVHHKQRQDQFREVGEDARLAAETEEKLRLHREEVARQGGRVELDAKHTYTENAPQVSHTDRKHVIEEVQPVIEKDVLRPHVVEEQQNVFVHHQHAPKLHETRVAPSMTVQEYERSQASNDEHQTFRPDDAVDTTATR